MEALQARTMARKARVSLKDEANAKVKRKAKVEDVDALTGRTRTRATTRTRTGPGKTRTLRQGGPILSPLEGSKTRGPTTRSQTQAQQEQGAKRGNEDRDESNPRNPSRFMRMAPILRKRSFEVTCPADF